MRPFVKAALAVAALASACRGGGPAPGEPVKMTVTKNGYEPWKIPAKAGEKLVLEITRTADETCATELVIPEAGVDAKLPLNQPVRVELTPQKAGELRFSCAMRMFQGVIEAR
jgi:plastocyanin domain-containing protein